MIFFGGGGGSRKSICIVYRCTLSDMVLITGNVGGQARQGKDGIYKLLITTPTNIREIQISSCIHRSSPFRIHTFFFRTGVVENSFTTNMKLGNFTAAHAQTQVAVKNKWEVDKNTTKTVKMNDVIWNNSRRFRRISSRACDTYFPRP